MTNRANFEPHMAYLSGDFGEQIALKWSGKSLEELEKLVGGRLSKGKRVGRLRGTILWIKCIQGGWVKTGSYDWDAQRGNGFVQAPGRIVAKAILDKDLYLVWAQTDHRHYEEMLDHLFHINKKPFASAP